MAIKPDPTKTAYADLTNEERAAMTQDEKLDYLQANRDARFEATAAERAAADPMTNYFVRPDAPQVPGMIQYYSWIGGRTTGGWTLYSAVDTPGNQQKYGSRIFGGETKATPQSITGVNGLKNQPKFDATIGTWKEVGTTLPSPDGTPPPGGTPPPIVTTTPPPVVTTTPPPSGGTPPPASVTKVVGTFTDPKTGDVYSLSDDGTKELLSEGTKQADALSAKEAADAKTAAEEYNAKMVADAKTQEIKEERQSAYETLKDEFTKYGLGSDEFLAEVKNLILTGTPTSQATLKLRGTNEYAARFAGNQERRNAGKNVYDEATYLSLENQYRETFGAYGLDNLLGDTKTAQAKLAQYIGQDKSPLEIKKRIQMAVEQVQNRTDVRLMFAEYYPQITDKDLVSYFLEPKDTLASLESKVNIASIGSTAMRQGLVADIGTSQALSEMGVTEDQAAAGYKNVATVLPDAQRLTAIEGGKYTQSEAEGAYLKNLASEQRKIAKLAEREQARFTGSSGVNKASLTSSTKGQLY